MKAYKKILFKIYFLLINVNLYSASIDEYSINLMWINKVLNIQQKYISSAKDKNNLHRNLLAPVIKWAIANKDAEVNLWYDSVHTTVEAVDETKKELDILTSKQSINNIYLRNIRDIPIISINKDAFSDQTPIYYRVDILKAIIIVFSIENENKDVAIFTDLEVGNRRPNKDRMGKDELFDSATMKKLEKYGLIHNYIENQFLQLKNNELMIKSIKHAIINANLMRAEFILNSQERSDYWGHLFFPVWKKMFITIII